MLKKLDGLYARSIVAVVEGQFATRVLYGPRNQAVAFSKEEIPALLDLLSRLALLNKIANRRYLQS